MASASKLFPVIMLRVAGGPLADLQRTELPETMAIANEVIRTQQKTTELARVLSDKLYKLIPQAPDSATRQLWINTRRSIHNHRALPASLGHILGTLPKHLQGTLRSYIHAQTKLHKLQQQAEQQYTAETIAAKHVFASLLQKNTNFQNGLLLSSSTIIPSLKKYLANEVHTTVITKKERSFMEYLSRMYTKPTPFSSFTHLVTATFASRQQSKNLLVFNDFKTSSHIHLNHDLYRYLYGLLVLQPKVRQLMPIKLNPTIKKENKTYSFLTNHNNLEAFQHIDATPALDILYTLAAKARRQVRYGEFVSFIASKKYINASAPDITKYVDQLIELGFFELTVGVSGIDREWDKKLRQQLMPLVAHAPLLDKAASGLAAVRELANNYETAPTKQRLPLLDEAFETFKATSELLGGTTGSQEKPQKQTAEQEEKIFRHVHSKEFAYERHRLWYEDTTLEDDPQISPSVQRGMELLGDLLGRMKDFDGCQAEQEKMTYFFQTEYGKEATIDLLQFYKEYSRNKFDWKSLKIPATVKRETNNQKAQKLFLKNIGKQSATAEVHFDRQAVAHIPLAQQSSFAAFLHTYRLGNSTRLILSSTAEGWGRMFSRFLYLFDPVITEKLQQSYQSTDDNILLAEVTDASFFNGNLHPRIMPYEIITPGGHPSLPPSARLDAHHLAISYDKKQSRLILRHTPSGKEVKVFDLGFQGRRGRSKLYGLLCTFTVGGHHNVHGLLKGINERVRPNASSKENEIVVLPRIVYENRIILQRKIWHIPKTELPVPETGESAAAYFLRLQQWRCNLNIPDEVFVRGAYYKPQYLSFKNPFLVAIFESCIRSCKDEMRIEEMLPDSSQLTPTGGRVVELLAQWRV